MKRVLFYIMMAVMVSGSVMAGSAMTAQAAEVKDVMREALGEDNVLSDEASEQTETSEAESDEKLSEMIPMNAFMQTNDEANLRKGPGTDYESSGKAEIGKTVMVTGQSQDGEWYRIIYDGEETYIAAQYLSEQEINADIEEEMQQSVHKAEAEATQELQEAQARAEQEAAEIAAAEKAAAEQAAAEQEKAEAKRQKKKVPVALVVAIVFILVFVLSLLILLRKETERENAEKKDGENAAQKPAEQKQKEEDGKGELEIIDLENEDNEE